MDPNTLQLLLGLQVRHPPTPPIPSHTQANTQMHTKPASVAISLARTLAPSFLFWFLLLYEFQMLCVIKEIPQSPAVTKLEMDLSLQRNTDSKPLSETYSLSTFQDYLSPVRTPRAPVYYIKTQFSLYPYRISLDQKSLFDSFCSQGNWFVFWNVFLLLWICEDQSVKRLGAVQILRYTTRREGL